MLQARINRRKFLGYAGGAVIAAVATVGFIGPGPLPGLIDLFAAPVAAQADGRTYQEVVTQEFIPRINVALTNIRTALVAAGVPANSVTVTELDSVDLRYQIVARRAGRTLTGYIELTDGLHVIGEAGRGQAIFTFWLDSDGVEITTAYAPGGLSPYTTEAGLDALLAKLAQVEATVPEAIVKARASFGL